MWPKAPRCRRATSSGAQFGEEYLAAGPQLFGGAKQGSNTQDAHEAVRPSDPSRRPDDVKRFLKDDQFRLYQLIWQRFMASQMAPAVFDTTTLDFDVPGDGSQAVTSCSAPRAAS